MPVFVPKPNQCIGNARVAHRALKESVRATRGMPSLRRLADMETRIEERLLQTHGVGRRAGERMRAARRIFGEIAWSLRPLSDFLASKGPSGDRFARRMLKGFEQVQQRMGLKEQLRAEARRIGIKDWSKEDMAVFGILDSVPVSRVVKLLKDGKLNRKTLAIAGTTAAATAAIGLGLKNLKTKEQVAFVGDVAKFYWERRGESLIAWKESFIKRNPINPATKKAWTKVEADVMEPDSILGQLAEQDLGQTLSAYIPHILQTSFLADVRHEVLDRMAPWVNATEQSLGELIETAVSATAKSPRTITIGTGRNTRDVVSGSTTELLEHIFPGFKQRFKTKAEQEAFITRLAEGNAAAERKLKAYAPVIPEEMWVRFFQERRGGANYELSALQTLDAYTPAVARKAFLEPAVKDVMPVIQQFIQGDPETAWALTQYLKQVMGSEGNFAPAASRAVGTLTRWAYGGTLLGNVSAGFVNLTQPLMFTIPEAGFRDAWAGAKLMMDPRWNELVGSEVGQGILMQSVPFLEAARPLELFRKISTASNLPTALRTFGSATRASIDVMARAEYFNRSHAFATGVAKRLREGGALSTWQRGGDVSKDLLSSALDEGFVMVRKTQFMFLSSDQPALIRQLNRLPGGQFFTIFTNFPTHATSRFYQWTKDFFAGANPEIRKEGFKKLMRFSMMGNLIAGPFFFAPFLRESLEKNDDETAQQILEVMTEVEDRYSIAGWLGVELASRISPADFFAGATAVFARSGLFGGEAGDKATPVPRFIISGLEALGVIGDPFSQEIAKGRVLGALAPFTGGRAPSDLPVFGLPPDLAPMIPAGVAFNRFLRSMQVLSDPARRLESGGPFGLSEVAEAVDVKGRPLRVVTFSDEVKRQYGRPLREFREAVRGRAQQEVSEQKRLDRQTIRQLVLDGDNEGVFQMLTEQPELTTAIEPALLEQEAFNRTLLPQARAFRSAPFFEAMLTFQRHAERLNDADLSQAERTLSEQIVMLGVAKLNAR